MPPDTRVRFNAQMPTPNALLAGVLSAAALLAPTTAAHAAEPDLLARWALDTVGSTTPNAVDARLDGTNVAGTTVTGRFGSALSITNTPATEGFFASDTDKLVERPSVTVLAWVKGSAAPTSWSPIVAKSGAGRADGGAAECELSAFALTAGAGEGPHFSVTTADGSRGSLTLSMSDALPAADVWDGQWHAVAGIFDASTSSLSVALDGKIVKTTTSDGAAIAYDGFPKRGLAVGRYPESSCDFPGQGYAGSVDEVRIYGRALTASELAHLQDAAATTPPTLTTEGTSPTPGGQPGPEAPGSSGGTPPTGSTPAPANPIPTPLIVPPAGSVKLGNSQKTKAPQAALRAALEQAKGAVLQSLIAPKAASQIFKTSPNLSKKERAKLKTSRSLDALLDELEFGLPVRVKAPANARYVQIGAALSIRRKTPSGRIEINTIALPSVVLPVVRGVASGRISIDPTAAKVIRASGAIDAAVAITSVAVTNLPKATSEQQALIDKTLAKQVDLTKQLEKDKKQLDDAQKTVAKFAALADQAKGSAAEKKADERQKEAERKADHAEEAAEQSAGDLAKQQQEALDEMIKQIIDFIRELKEQQTQSMHALTRI